MHGTNNIITGQGSRLDVQHLQSLLFAGAKSRTLYFILLRHHYIDKAELLQAQRRQYMLKSLASAAWNERINCDCN